MLSIKNILERWDQSLDLMENPKQAGKTTAIGTYSDKRSNAQ
jgi:hypothetical protein